VLDAMARLAELASGEIRRSSLWLTTPVDCPPGSERFINAAVAFEVDRSLTPERLLADLKSLEREFGRGPAPVRNAPRELDLDLILFDDEVRDSPDFTLPHPRAVDRLFVLAPAREVLPDAIWPGTRRSIRELHDALDTDEEVRRLEEGDS
jgi:2-amino-4-hydroxy-6-hydroxymethyldihydropteridine diphosphokinase